nr:MAG TPA: YadA-like protein [Caudoviricetes sp.]
MFDKDNKFGFINNNENNNNIKDTNLPYTISSKVLVTVPASDIKLGKINNINNISIKKDRRYYIEFLGSKNLCSVMMSKETGDSIVCSIEGYVIQVFNRLTDLALFIRNTNTEDTPISTDLVIYEEEVKYLDSKYLENNLVAQNSISLGRTGDIGMASVAIGVGVEASGNGSFAQGGGAKASNNSAHAEGMNTTASGASSHAEGTNTTASGYASHAEGNSAIASGEYGSHAEGYKTKAEGESSHAEGDHTIASGNSSHAEGSRTIASGIYSHAEGSNTTASGDYSHSEGEGTTASSQNQHVQGKYNIEDTNNKYAHIVGNGDIINKSNAHTLDWEGNAWYAGEVQGTNLPYTISSKVLTTVPASDIKIDDEIIINNFSINGDRRYYIEFLNSKKLGSLLISKKNGNCIMCSIGNYSIQAYKDSTNIILFIGKINKDDTTAINFTDLVIYEEEVKYLDSKYLETDLVLHNSISLGRVGYTGTGSSAIGSNVTASGQSSHAEGGGTVASGQFSHAEGDNTTASGQSSHAEGSSTKASSDYQHVQGKFNIEDDANKYAHIVGNGKKDSSTNFKEVRSNAHTLDWNGNAWFAGKVTQEGTPTEDKDLTTKKYVDDNAVNKYSQLNERPIEVFPYTEKLNKVTNVTQKLCTIDVADLKADTTYMCPDNCGRLVLQYTKLDNSKISFYMSYSPNSLIIQTGYKNDKQIEILIDGIVYTVTFKTATEEPKVEQTVRYLTDKNTTEYTPTGDYNPATKKYVDDKVASSPQLSFNESGELVVTINGVSKIFVPKSE